MDGLYSLWTVPDPAQNKSHYDTWCVQLVRCMMHGGSLKDTCRCRQKITGSGQSAQLGNKAPASLWGGGGGGELRYLSPALYNPQLYCSPSYITTIADGTVDTV